MIIFNNYCGIFEVDYYTRGFPYVFLYIQLLFSTDIPVHLFLCFKLNKTFLNIIYNIVHQLNCLTEGMIEGKNQCEMATTQE